MNGEDTIEEKLSSHLTTVRDKYQKQRHSMIKNLKEQNMPAVDKTREKEREMEEHIKREL